MAIKSNVTNTPALVSPGWLATRLSRADICVIDASWYLPSDGRDTVVEYRAEHIPGAVFFDIDTVADLESSLPHMLPTAAEFVSMMTELGIGDDMRLVVYDSHGLMSAARVWWTFRAFGHGNVSVLNGGLPAWKRAGHRVNRCWEATTIRSGSHRFRARLNRSLVRSLDQVLANLKSGKEQLIDARPPGRFAGIDSEPREGLRSGHVPGSYNVPFQDLLEPDSNQLLPPDRIKGTFLAAGIDVSQSVVTSCGSGITACVIALALHTIGETDVAVYDGSWAEWGQRKDTPIDTLQP